MESYRLWKPSTSVLLHSPEQEVPSHRAPNHTETVPTLVRPSAIVLAEPARLRVKRKRKKCEEDCKYYDLVADPKRYILPGSTAEPDWHRRKKAKKAVDAEEMKEVENLVLID